MLMQIFWCHKFKRKNNLDAIALSHDLKGGGEQDLVIHIRAGSAENMEIIFCIA